MILVTGSAGYIGSHICHYLDKKKIRYHSIDNLSRGSKNNIRKKFSLVDIGDSKKILNIVFLHIYLVRYLNIQFFLYWENLLSKNVCLNQIHLQFQKNY